MWYERINPQAKTYWGYNSASLELVANLAFCKHVKIVEIGLN